mgnify:CR=1 FL=1
MQFCLLPQCVAADRRFPRCAAAPERLAQASVVSAHVRWAIGEAVSSPRARRFLGRRALCNKSCRLEQVCNSALRCGAEPPIGVSPAMLRVTRPRCAGSNRAPIRRRRLHAPRSRGLFVQFTLNQYNRVDGTRVSCRSYRSYGMMPRPDSPAWRGLSMNAAGGATRRRCP